MKKLIISFFILGASASFAAANTDLNSKWICTTNASSSETATDKTADDKMANNQSSALESFNFAAKNCRDCTKITCELKE